MHPCKRACIISARERREKIPLQFWARENDMNKFTSPYIAARISDRRGRQSLNSQRLLYAQVNFIPMADFGRGSDNCVQDKFGRCNEGGRGNGLPAATQGGAAVRSIDRIVRCGAVYKPRLEWLLLLRARQRGRDTAPRRSRCVIRGRTSPRFLASGGERRRRAICR